MRKLFKKQMILNTLGVVVVAGASMAAQAQRGGDNRGSVVVQLSDRDRCMSSRSDRDEVNCFRDITDPRRADNGNGGGGGGGRNACTTVSLCVDTDSTLTLTSNYINASNASTLSHPSCPAHLDGVILLGLGPDERVIRNTELPMSLPFRRNIESFQKLSGRGKVEGSVENGVLKVRIKDESRGAGVYTLNVCTTR